MNYNIYKDNELVNKIVADEDFCKMLQDLGNIDHYELAIEPEAVPYIPSYLDLRRAEYPSYLERIEAIWYKLQGNSQTFDVLSQKIQEIDRKYPEPSTL